MFIYQEQELTIDTAESAYYLSTNSNAGCGVSINDWDIHSIWEPKPKETTY